MRGSGLLALVAVIAPGLGGAALADIHLGTATGGIAVYYNTSWENPANQAYYRAQRYNSVTNVEGALFTWDPALAPVFNDLGQFRLDLIQQALTWDGILPIPAVPGMDRTPPPTYAYNPTPVSGLAWAINNYQSGQVVDSQLRGFSGATGIGGWTPVSGGWQVTFSGTLTSDGLIHWYTAGVPDTSLASIGLPNWSYFSGTLTYLTAQDTTPGMDFYAGQIEFYAVPAPGAVVLGMIGFGLVGWVKRRFA